MSLADMASEKPRWDDPAHWRGRGEDMRALAKQTHDPKTQRMMIKLADDYEKLARRAEERSLLKRL
jgi:hypothetical protein